MDKKGAGGAGCWVSSESPLNLSESSSVGCPLNLPLNPSEKNRQYHDWMLTTLAVNYILIR